MFSGSGGALAEKEEFAEGQEEAQEEDDPLKFKQKVQRI